MSVKEAIEIYQRQSDSIHKLWAYFQIVSLAVVGYAIESSDKGWSGFTYVLIAVSYLFFAVANQWVIYLSQKELCRAGEVVRLLSEGEPILRNFLVVTVEPWKLSAFHAIATMFVVSAIIVSWRG